MPMTLNVVNSIGYSSTTKFIQIMTLVDIDLFYNKARSDLVPFAFVWENV